MPNGSRLRVDDVVAERRTPGTGSARKVLQVLFSFSERRTSATVAELAELVGAPIPTAYRHVALLKELQLLEEGPAGTYHPTARVMPLARAAQLSSGLSELARPIVEETSDAFNETVMLMQHYGEGVVCIELKECDRAMRFTFQRGHSLPLGFGASGKMALALMAPHIREAWSQASGRTELEAEFVRVAELGYATSTGEVDEGVWACSVPVLADGAHPVVLTVAGPAARFDEEARSAAPEILQRSAERIRRAAQRFSL